MLSINELYNLNLININEKIKIKLQKNEEKNCKKMKKKNCKKMKKKKIKIKMKWNFAAQKIFQ